MAGGIGQDLLHTVTFFRIFTRNALKNPLNRSASTLASAR